jgi:broad specificity phosphatase PhoE
MYAQNSTLLIRHAQASFGASDYDQLSALGIEQARLLGKHLKRQRCQFEAIYLGELKRHQQTLNHILDSGLDAPVPLISPALNEYDADALLLAYQAASHSQATQDQHFKALRSALRLWMSGGISPIGMPSYAEFKRNLLDFLGDIRSQHSGPVMVVTSGGPISTMVGSLFEANVDATISLNYRLRNASITELTHDPKRHQLVGLNHIEHLADPEQPSRITHI